MSSLMTTVNLTDTDREVYASRLGMVIDSFMELASNPNDVFAYEDRGGVVGLLHRASGVRIGLWHRPDYNEDSGRTSYKTMLMWEDVVIQAHGLPAFEDNREEGRGYEPERMMGEFMEFLDDYHPGWEEGECS